VPLDEEETVEIARRDRLTMPPGLSEAMTTLSKGLLRCRWHCENLARSVSPDRSERPPATASTAAPGCGRVLADATAAAPTPCSGPACGLASAPTVVFGFAATEPQALDPPRRLEVTVRGNFRSGDRSNAEATAVVDVEGPRDSTESNVVLDNSSVTVPSAPSSPRVVRAATLPLRAVSVQNGDEDVARELMGFGKDEVGATPSGRSSVPAVRGSSSAPPLPGTGADEGIELAVLAHSMEQHVRRVLERSLRGEPSRAASCEPVDERCISPSPAQRSPPRSLCPSPCLRLNMEEQLSLAVALRLCRSRCGSSSAVLELTLDHSAECNEVCGCRCWPAPEDAEARLLAHFGRHSLLRLSAKRPPVRVFLEPLPDAREVTDGED